MLANLSSLNYLAILAATFISFVVGGVWFAVLMVKPYAFALGRENQPAAKPTALFMVGPLVCSLITILTLALLMKQLQISTVLGALELGLVVGTGLISATMMNIAINPNFPRPFRYAAVNAPYFIFVSVMTCVLLAVMG